MEFSNSVGAARPRRNVLRALSTAASLSLPWVAATAAPVLSGTPTTSITAAHFYAFQPGATDSAGKKLTFAIANKPSWAQFDPGSGRLYGTPSPVSNVGTYANILISASDGASRATLPPFSLRVLPLPNTPPVIGGAPATTVTAGHSYVFQPTARDPNGLRVAFGIWNKPAWATFNSATGSLSGVPTAANVGMYPNVIITAYDGFAKAQLPAFSIIVQPASTSVTPPSPGSSSSSGSATLSWSPPTENTNGTPLTNLAGYHIYYGTTPSLGQKVTVANPGLTRYVISGLTAATWYFQMTAYDSTGVESPPTPLETLIMQ